MLPILPESCEQEGGDKEGMKIRVSFERPSELAELLWLLDPVIKSYKIAKNQQGLFTKAYIDIDNNKLSKIIIQKRSVKKVVQNPDVSYNKQRQEG